MKRRIAAMVLAVSMMGTLGACGEPAGRTAGPALSQSSSETQTDSEKVWGTLKVSTSGESGKPVFTVETNMPDETEFVLTLQSEDYTQQQTVVVAGGSGRQRGESDREFYEGGKHLQGAHIKRGFQIHVADEAVLWREQRGRRKWRRQWERK